LERAANQTSGDDFFAVALIDIPSTERHAHLPHAPDGLTAWRGRRWLPLKNVILVLHYPGITDHESYIMPRAHYPSVAVRRTLRKLGQDIRDARRRRGLPAEVVAHRAFTSRPAVQRVESGDHGVSIGIYAAVLQALGLLDEMGQIADPSRDQVGLALASEKLPERVRLPRSREVHDG
jgi:hypothetical protein